MNHSDGDSVWELETLHCVHGEGWERVGMYSSRFQNEMFSNARTLKRRTLGIFGAKVEPTPNLPNTTT